jgi:hypothetical protein
MLNFILSNIFELISKNKVLSDFFADYVSNNGPLRHFQMIPSLRKHFINLVALCAFNLRGVDYYDKSISWCKNKTLIVERAKLLLPTLDGYNAIMDEPYISEAFYKPNSAFRFYDKMVTLQMDYTHTASLNSIHELFKPYLVNKNFKENYIFQSTTLISGSSHNLPRSANTLCLYNNHFQYNPHLHYKILTPENLIAHSGKSNFYAMSSMSDAEAIQGVSIKIKRFKCSLHDNVNYISKLNLENQLAKLSSNKNANEDKTENQYMGVRYVKKIKHEVSKEAAVSISESIDEIMSNKNNLETLCGSLEGMKKETEVLSSLKDSFIIPNAYGFVRQRYNVHKNKRVIREPRLCGELNAMCPDLDLKILSGAAVINPGVKRLAITNIRMLITNAKASDDIISSALCMLSLLADIREGLDSDKDIDNNISSSLSILNEMLLRKDVFVRKPKSTFNIV